MSVPVKVYDENLDIVADLQNATNIQYNKRLNEIWSASFTLPADDDKNDLFGLLNFARIYDGEKNIGLFRIDEKYPQRSEEDTTVRYECSHVLDTLNDDYVALTAKTTKTGTSTTINYILDQQTTTNWQLGTLDFSKSFEHEFSRQTLFNALLQVPQPWWEDYEITFDTSSYPWTINIVEPDSTPKATLRYGKNMASIEKEVNAKELVTKLYAYGSGSGDEQVSAGPYTSNTGTYGTIVGIWEEQYFDNASDLGTAAQKYLDRVDTPRVVYRGDAADLYRILDINEIELGEYITIYDPELGEDTKAQVVEMRKSDMTGDPGRLQLELSNKSRRFPNYKALAFRDKATEDNLAAGSVSGGAGGALATGGTGTDALANEAVTWDKVQFKDASGDYMEQTRLKIDALVTFENNFTEIDKLDDGTTYAKMRKDWRSASDVTKIAGGEIYTDSVTLDQVNFSPVENDEVIASINASAEALTIQYGKIDQDVATENNVVSKINLNKEGIEIQGENIELDGNTTVEGTFQVSQGNVIVDQNIDMGEGGGYNKILGCEQISGDSGVGIGLIGNINLGNDTYISAGFKFYTDAGQGMDTQGGPIAMGGGNISNPGLVDGVNISSHVGDLDAHHDPYTQIFSILAAGDNIVLGSDGTNITVHVSGINEFSDSKAVSAIESTDIDLGFNNLDAGTITADTEVKTDEIQGSGTFEFNGFYEVNIGNAALGGVEETIGGTLDGTGYDGYVNINGHIVGFYN